jgi:hypothetical protein
MKKLGWLTLIGMAVVFMLAYLAIDTMENAP